MSDLDDFEGVLAATTNAASSVDLDLLEDLLPELAEAEDGRQAKRLIERRLPADAAEALAGVVRTANLQTALVALAAAIRTARAVRNELGETTVVWSGPTVRTLAVRPTRQVVLDLINRARISLTLVTYVSYDIDDLVKALDEARLNRKVEVRLVVDTKQDSKDSQGPKASKAFKNVPRAVPVYRWPRENRGEKGGIMHVKTVIQDRRAMLLSSANLTSAAFDRNMELGLLVEGGHLPERVDRHFDELIDNDELQLLNK